MEIKKRKKGSNLALKRMFFSLEKIFMGKKIKLTLKKLNL